MVRTFQYLDYDVKWVVNITDVGHLTGENLGDPDTGEDKMEVGAKREGISVEEVAEKYTNQFLESLAVLNIQKPDVLPRATKHIREQIDLIKKIEDNGYAYRVGKGLIFDTSKFEGYADFAGIDPEKQIEGARVEPDPEKKNPTDFYLWITGKKDHIMQWDSPWGRGFPGWHIECTAMSVEYLGEKFDIHTGGKEHIPVHHTNEVAQAYGAFQRQTANYWLHNDWLRLKGEKMSKSLGNILTIQDLMQKGYNPVHFRYLVLTSHYRKGLVFSFDSLDAAGKAYGRLVEMLRSWREGGRDTLSEGKMEKIDKFRDDFVDKVANDLNFPEAISVVWKVTKSNIPNRDKLDLILDFDEILGLRLSENIHRVEVPAEVQKLIEKREDLREKGDFKGADEIRREIEKKGYILEDRDEGPGVKKL
jgi:cysteinyl-tRNA synthetase